MAIGRERLRQDVGYVLQGFVSSLVVLLTAGLTIAALILLLLAIAPGSLGEVLRTLIIPSSLMTLMLVGAIADIAILWGLSRIHVFPPQTRLRLGWFVGLTVGITLVLSAIFLAFHP